jgi:hypothetical protein
MWCRRRVACGQLRGIGTSTTLRAPPGGRAGEPTRTCKQNVVLVQTECQAWRQAARSRVDHPTMPASRASVELCGNDPDLPGGMPADFAAPPAGGQATGCLITDRQQHIRVSFSAVYVARCGRLAGGYGHGTVVATHPHLEFRTLCAAWRRRARFPRRFEGESGSLRHCRGSASWSGVAEVVLAQPRCTVTLCTLPIVRRAGRIPFPHTTVLTRYATAVFQGV